MGGTIDSEYDVQQDMIAPARHSFVMKYMKSLRLEEEIEFSVICLKDARDIDEWDIKKLIETIKHSTTKKMMVIHGYQTMIDSMTIVEKEIGVNIEEKDQTVVFVWARIPLSLWMSDAGFQLWCAYSSLSTQDAGIYACVSWKTIGLVELKKKQEEGRLNSFFAQ